MNHIDRIRTLILRTETHLKFGGLIEDEDELVVAPASQHTVRVVELAATDMGYVISNWRAAADQDYGVHLIFTIKEA